MSILGLDIGTSGTKALVFNSNLELISNSYEEYSLTSNSSGYFEFEVNDLKRAILNVIKSTASAVKSYDPVKAIGVSVIGSCSLPVDKNFKPLHNAIIANDHRGDRELQNILVNISEKDLYNISGQPLNHISYLSKILSHF